MNPQTGLLALLIFNLPGILIGSWGNLEIYLRTYYYYKTGFTKENFALIPILFLVVLNASMIVVPFVVRRFYNIYLYASLSIATSFMYMLICKTYLLVEFYLIMILITLSSRLLISICNFTASELYPSSRSFAIGFVLSGISLSNVLWNFVMTAVINPENEPMSAEGLFSIQVGSKVPIFMNYLAVFSFICCILGTLAIDYAVFAKPVNHNDISESVNESINASITNKNRTEVQAIQLKEYFVHKQNISCMKRTMSDQFQINGPAKEDNRNIPRITQMIELYDGNDQFDNSRGINFDKVETNYASQRIGQSSLRKLLTSNEPDFIHDKSPAFSTPKGLQESKKVAKLPTKSQPLDIIKDDEEKLSIKDDENPTNDNESMSERQLLEKYVFQEKFKVLFLTSFVRNMFAIYFMNNFKNIALININDDHFLSYSSSFAYLLSLGFQMFGGMIVDKFGIMIATIGIYILFLFVIAMYLLFASSKFAFLLAIIAYRITFGMCVTLNNSSLYNIYPKMAATRLLKYYFLNSVLGVIAGNIVEYLFVSEQSYVVLWIFYMIIICFMIFYALGNLKNLDFNHG